MTTNKVILFGIASIFIACGGKSTTTVPTPTMPTASSLWALAPADAVAGVVIADGGLEVLRNWAAEAIRVADARPFTAQLTRKIRDRLSKMPADPFDDQSLMRIGLDLTKGAAIFVNQAEQLTMILPVVNRVSFVSAIGGSSTADGIDSFGNTHCNVFETRYVCSDSMERLTMIGAAPTNMLAQAATSQPPALHGDVVMLVDSAKYDLSRKLPGLNQYLSNPGILVAAAKMTRGNLTVHAYLPGAPIGRAQKLLAAPSALSSVVAAERPSSFVRMRIDPSDIPKPSENLGGINLADVLGTLTGEVIGMTHAGTNGSASFQIGLNSPDSFRSLTQMGCNMVGNFIPFLNVKLEGAACRGNLDLGGIPGANLQRFVRETTLALDLDVQNDRLDIRSALGTKGPVTNAPSPSEFGAGLLSGEWNIAVWGEGLSTIYLGELINFAGIPNVDVNQIKAGLWMVGHLYESGIGFGVRSDGFHGALEVTSFAADNDVDYAAYESALAKAIDGDVAGASLAMETLAKSSPTSLAARQVGFKSGAWWGAASIISGMGAGMYMVGARSNFDSPAPTVNPPAPVTP